MHRRFIGVSYFSHAKPSSLHYIRRRRSSPSQHTNIWSLYLTTHLLYSFSCSSSIVSKARATWRACLLGRKATLVMNIKSSSIVMLSYLQYSNTYELDYSSHVIIMIYELAYSLCVVILTCSNLCLIIHMMCMSRSRARVEVTIRRSFEVAYILACQSVVLESRGDIGSFLVHGRGARGHMNLWI